MEEVGCSQATIYRLIDDLRALGAPLEQSEQGYFYDRDLGEFELPGIWVSDAELAALLSAKMLLSGVQPGLLETELQELSLRIGHLLERKGIDQITQQERIRIVNTGRSVAGDMFRTILTTLSRQQRASMLYHARGRDEFTHREVSPQRLVRYRGSWYLDAWCHLRQAIRSFAVERIAGWKISEAAFHSVSAEELEAHVRSSFGIFSGEAAHIAQLKFSPERARWVADEHWHSKQQQSWLDDGCLRLSVPFSHSEELLMEILRHTPHVTVQSPKFLRDQVIDALKRGMQAYDN